MPVLGLRYFKCLRSNFSPALISVDAYIPLPNNLRIVVFFEANSSLEKLLSRMLSNSARPSTSLRNASGVKEEELSGPKQYSLKVTCTSNILAPKERAARQE